MTPKEKFLELVSEEKSNTLEKIRNRRQEKMDNYAIEFAEWILYQDITQRGRSNFVCADGVQRSTKELLEIFKKEKGL